MIRKKIFILNKNSSNNIFSIIENTPNKCKLFKKENNHFFQLIHNQWKEIQFDFWNVKLDEMREFHKIILDLISDAFNKVPTIKTSTFEDDNYFIKVSGKIDGIVYSLLNKYFEHGNQLRFVSELLIRITHAHAYSNGNKRTAIVSACLILNFFGFYLKFSNNKEKYISYWENLMIDISSWKEREVRKSKFSHLSEEELIDEIHNIIINNLWLKL